MSRRLTAGGGMVLGMTFGMAVGLLFGHMVLGMSFGMMFGLIFGGAVARRRRRSDAPSGSPTN